MCQPAVSALGELWPRSLQSLLWCAAAVSSAVTWKALQPRAGELGCCCPWLQSLPRWVSHTNKSAKTLSVVYRALRTSSSAGKRSHGSSVSLGQQQLGQTWCLWCCGLLWPFASVLRAALLILGFWARKEKNISIVFLLWPDLVSLPAA